MAFFGSLNERKSPIEPFLSVILDSNKITKSLRSDEIMRYFVVDAFAEKIFEGNPAGVCVMKDWL